MEGDRQSIPGSHLVPPALGPNSTLSLPQLPGRGLMSDGAPPPTSVGSESKECRPGGPGALSVRASTWQYGMLALLVLGRQWKWLPGLIRRKPTKGLASQYSGKGAGRGVWIPRVLGPLLTLWVTVNLLPDGSPQFCHLTSGDTTPYPACFTN